MTRRGRIAALPTRTAVLLAAPWARWWFRVRVAGRELLPPGPCLAAATHSGLGFSDLAALIWLQGVGATGRPFRAAAHRFLTGRWLARATRAAGGVPGDRRTVAGCLAEGISVLVCPGGCTDSMRPVWKARSADWGGRTGLVEAAREAGVPIVPLVIHGSARTYWCLGSLRLPRALARVLGGKVRAVEAALRRGPPLTAARLPRRGRAAAEEWRPDPARV